MLLCYCYGTKVQSWELVSFNFSSHVCQFVSCCFPPFPYSWFTFFVVPFLCFYVPPSSPQDRHISIFACLTHLIQMIPYLGGVIRDWIWFSRIHYRSAVLILQYLQDLPFKVYSFILNLALRSRISEPYKLIPYNCFVFSELVFWLMSFESVSYTHLDVYKRQI